MTYPAKEVLKLSLLKTKKCVLGTLDVSGTQNNPTTHVLMQHVISCRNKQKNTFYFRTDKPFAGQEKAGYHSHEKIGDNY